MSTSEDLLGFAPEGPGEFDPSESQIATQDRGQNRSWDIEAMSDPKKFARWMLITKSLTLEAIDDLIVDKTYAAAIWYFRQAAVTGDLKWTKSMESWLAWAKPIVSRPKKRQTPKPSKGSVAFMPREPGNDADDEN